MLPGMLAISYNAVIIDSDKNYRKSLASIIRQHFKIRDIYTCSSAREAIGISRQLEKVDIVLCDSELADHSALQLIADLKQTKSSAGAHYVLLSNNSKREFLLEAAAVGVSAFILKPFTTKTVTEKIKKLINGKTQRQSRRIKLFNTVTGYVAFKNAKYKGEVDDLSSGGCMIRLPMLESGGTIYDQCAIRISYEENSVDIVAELIRLERDTSDEQKNVNAAFIFKEMNEETQQAFEKVWKLLDKSNPQTDETETESNDQQEGTE